MRRTGFSFVLVLLAASMAVPQSSRPSANVVLLSSPDAKGVITTEQLTRCLQQVAEQWKVNPESLPKVVVVHVSEEVARKVPVSGKITIRRNHSENGQDSYYEVWIVGEPSNQTIALAMDNVVENRFQLHVTQQQRIDVVNRVSRFQDATMSAFANR
ncbi:MAG: hypothetical protein ACXVZX_10115 [Terriglobales bacterium]